MKTRRRSASRKEVRKVDDKERERLETVFEAYWMEDKAHEDFQTHVYGIANAAFAAGWEAQKDEK